MHDNEWITEWKVSKYGVISGPNIEKYGPEITPYLDTFYAVEIAPMYPSQTRIKNTVKDLWLNFLQNTFSQN